MSEQVSKWHISANGSPAPCTAKKQCRLSGMVAHGATEQEVIQKREKFLESHHERHLAGKNRTVSKVPKNLRPRVKKEYADRDFAIAPIQVPHDPNAKQAVLSDVDGTLTRGSLVLDHAIYLHDAKKIDLGDLPQKWRKNPKDEKLIVELAVKYRDEILGMKEEDLKLDEFLDEYEGKDNQFYSTMNQLKEFKRQGWEVQLISGSPNFLVQKFAERNGFFGKGSDYKTDENGRLNGKIDGMFGGEAKKGFIEKLGLKRFERVLAFGDTASDQPLFENSHHSTLVDPSEETEATVKATVIIRD